MTEPVTLPLNVPLCGGSIEMEIDASAPAADAYVQVWTCPYCGNSHAITLAERVLWVTVQSEPGEPN